MMKKSLVLAIGIAAATITIRAELIVKPLGETVSPEDMARFLTGGGVEVFNVEYTGGSRASGLFCAGEDIIGIDKGILLTSGCATNVIGSGGTNTFSGSTCENGLPGDSDLDGLLDGLSTFDASVLKFDFIPQGTNVTIRYVFSSEEYNEFVDTGFNDVFGFFVNGTNFALIPGTNLPVAIDNINNGFADAGLPATGPCKFCNLYVDNANLTQPPVQFEMDGLTKVLTLNAPVTPNATNTFRMAIGDTSDLILDSAVFIEARSLVSGSLASNCITRTAGYWFTHPKCSGTKGITTATLDEAMKEIFTLNCDVVDLGFMLLPVTFRNNDDDLDHKDAMLESLGFRWRSKTLTGEFGGLQSSQLPALNLCRTRKSLAVQYIAALANNALLRTDPANCLYVNSNGVLTNFPSNLLSKSLDALGSEDIEDMMAQRVLLKKFNSSGASSPLPPEIADPDTLACGKFSKDQLRKMSRDPSTQFNCPGLNDDCERAENIQTVPFTTTVDLTNYANRSPGSICGSGGKEAVWKIPSTMAAPFRPFTVTTDGSNFDTMITVRQGECGILEDGGGGTVDDLTIITCNNNNGGLLTSKTQFTVPEENTQDIFIIIEGHQGDVGELKVKITSP
jgi:hypothetical protein